MTLAETIPREGQAIRLQRHLSEMWPLRQPLQYVSEEQLYADLRLCLETFWDPPDPRYLDVACCTTLFSFRVHQFNTTPYPFLYGQKNSGKTRALDLFAALCYNPILSSSLSAAAIYQAVDKWHPTLLVDETDKWAKEEGESTATVLQILNSGYRRGQKVVRASREGSDPILYDVYGLKIAAGTELLPDTLMDRTIKLDMERNVRDVPLDIDFDVTEKLRGQLELYYNRYCLKHSEDIDVNGEDLKQAIGDNRTTELFYPLYAVCPTTEGRRNLLSMATDAVRDRHHEESMGDLAEVLEAIWIAMGQPDIKQLGSTPRPSPTELPLSDIIDACSFDSKRADVDPAKWIGWRIKKLQFSRDRKKNPAGKNVRLVLVEDRKLYRLARRYLPAAFAQTAETEKKEKRA